MEVNSKDNFYPRYGESETAIIEHNQDSLIGTAAIAPQGCTLAIGFEKENIFLKSQDEPITKIVFYPVMKESDYEVLLEDFILKHTVDYLPVIFDVVIHLKRVQSDLIPIQKLLMNPSIPSQVKYVLTRAIFPRMEGEGSDLLALHGFERTILREAAQRLVSEFENSVSPEFLSGARRMADGNEVVAPLETSVHDGKTTIHLKLEEMDTTLENQVIQVQDDRSEVCSATLSKGIKYFN